MKVTVLLKNEHEKLKSLFNKYKKPDTPTPKDRKEVFKDIRREILLHSQMETEIFYAALRGTSSTTAAELISTAEAEHLAIETLLQELNAMNPLDRAFEVKMTQMMEAVVQHIEREEEVIFGEARQNLPEYRLEELGVEMEDRRKMLTQLAA